MQIVIPHKSQAKLQAWISYLSKLSPRIRIKMPTEKDFADFLTRVEAWIRTEKCLNEEDIILGFPKAEDIAFVVCLDSSGSAKARYLPEDVRFFCFGNTAFGPGYFEWDGEPKLCDPNTYSLGGYSEEVLSWDHIRKLLISKIEELEARVPPLT